MTAPVWHAGPLGAPAVPGDAPFAWRTRLDDPATEALAAAAPLRAGDLADLAGRPHAGLRTLRRRLAKLLLARLAGVHPDAVAIGRAAGGAPVVASPAGWHLSVAGAWPWCLIGAGRRPLGVDLEPADADPPPDDCLTARERADLAGAPPTERVVRWTAKEAHAKLFGVAASIEAAAIGTWRVGDTIASMSVHGRATCCILRADGLVCTLARADAD